MAFIAGTIDMDVDALTVGLVVDPVPLVHIAIDVRKLTIPMSPIVFPATFVLGAIGPDLGALTISEATEPLASVLGSRAIGVRRPLLPLGMRVIRLV